MSSGVKTILGIGNALTDILAVLPDDTLLKTFHLPKGSMQHVDMETGDKIWAALRPLGVKYVAGGSAANTITCTSILGMPSSFIGKIGDDELGHLFKSDQEQYGVKTRLLAHEAGCIISLDMASYNVVESNLAFLHDIVEKYVDIVFANETESKAFTKLSDPVEALDEISRLCSIAVVKVGKDGSWIKSGDERHFIEAWPADTVDATGAGDTYAAGFLYAHSLGMPLKVCGEAGSIIAAKVVEVVGTKIDVPRWHVAKQEIRGLFASVEQR